MLHRLRACYSWWAPWCDSSFVKSVIRGGYRLPWKTGPPLVCRLRNHKGALDNSEFVTGAVEELISTGAAMRWPPGSRPHCVCPLNVAVQPSKLRLILDLRHVNDSLTHVKFKYEGIPRLPELLMKGDWMFSVDLKSGYHHIDVDPAYWTFLGFEWQGQCYAFRSLPFGLAEAPYTFTMVIKQLAKRWRARGIRLIPYVNDLLFMASSLAEALRFRDTVLKDLADSRFPSELEEIRLGADPHSKVFGFFGGQ